MVCGLPDLVWLGLCPGLRARVCVLGGGSPDSVAERRGGGSGEREQGAGKWTPAFWAWVRVPGRARRAVRPEAAWARAGNASPGRGAQPGFRRPPAAASPPEVAVTRVGGRDPPGAGAQPGSPSREVPTWTRCCRQVPAPARSRKSTHKYT